jgi:hypothetical protein
VGLLETGGRNEKSRRFLDFHAGASRFGGVFRAGIVGLQFLNHNGLSTSHG